MKKTLLSYPLILFAFYLSAQNVGIGTNTPAAKLEITSTTSGVLIPRVSLTSTGTMAPVVGATTSEMIYNDNTAGDVTPGFYFWTGSSWKRLVDVAAVDDVDWYESPGTTAPNDIADNIYTNGNVGIGVSTALQNLHVSGNIRVDGDTIMTVDNTATQFTMLSNGGIVMKLDNNDDGTGEEFSIKRGGIDLNSKVFTVTEAGNTDADGWGVFGGKGEFNGDLTILGNSRDLIVQDNFDIVGTGSVDIFLDSDDATDGVNNQSSFGILNDAGDKLLEIAEDTDLTLYGIGAAATGGVRLRELSGNGSNWIAITAPDNISSNRTFVWPNVYGGNGDVLTSNGAGILSWTTINVGVETITAGDALTNSGTATDPILDVTTDNLTISNTGTGGTLEVIGLPAGDGDYIQNQDAIDQSGAKFRVAGDGTVSDFNITGGDIYGPGINFGSNSDARLHSRIDIEMILDDDANGSEAFMIYKNGTIDDQNRVFIFEEGGTFKLKESGNVASPFYAGIVAGNLSADVTFTLPLNAGNNGEFLQTDGTGTMSWNDGSALQDHDWYEVGGTSQPNNISDDIFTQGSVGIGNSTPDAPLTIGDGTNSSAYVRIYRNNDPHIQFIEGTSLATSSTARIQGNIVGTHPQLQITSSNGATSWFNVNHDDGNVGIGTTNPSERLSIYPDQNESAEIGRAHVGYIGHNDWGGISHVDRNNQTDYALIQNGDGRTLVNAATSQTISLRINNTDQVLLQSDGDLEMKSDNVIHMPNNIVYKEYSTEVSFSGSGDNYKTNTNHETGTLTVESGDVIVVNVSFRGEMRGGSGGDDPQLKIYAVGASGCSNQSGLDRRWEDVEQFRDDYMPYAFTQIFAVSCSGTYKFRLEVSDSFYDDTFWVDDYAIWAVVH